jgi:acetylornithine/succinyldiaminopimelate/putrescine aminotransferase
VTSSSTPASTASRIPAIPGPLLAETCALIIEEKVPNFFRLWLNPFLAQVCYCLSRLVQARWKRDLPADAGLQSFLATSFDEALSGAVKLARYHCNRNHRPPLGLILDPEDKLRYFADITLRNRARIDFIPGLRRIVGAELEMDATACRERPGFVVLLPGPKAPWQHLVRHLEHWPAHQAPLIVAGIENRDLDEIGQEFGTGRDTCTPDIAVFDESFVNGDVPFGAFTARKALFDDWNRPRQEVFHSTTYQPNTISCLHFLRCLEQSAPAFYASLTEELAEIRRDPARCAAVLDSLYSSSMVRATTALDLDTLEARTDGHYIRSKAKRIFDGVAGVACSTRGHNPDSYVDEIESLSFENCRQALTSRLHDLTGLEHVIPAVSGASAGENALRLGLTAQFPRSYVLAFRGGFGGKTLLALTGTAKEFYKSHLEPLYQHVVYIDPFTDTAIQDLEAALAKYPVAIVQLELIQAVGGVRPIPSRVLSYLEQHKKRWGYLLLVDEVQTGMCRTGPFILSPKLGVTPDLLTIGKGISDMMFPFGLTLYSEEIRRKLATIELELPEALSARYDYEFGYKTVLNILATAERMELSKRVPEVGALFYRLLSEKLRGCRAVREVRVHGLLIGIELETTGWLRRRLKRLGLFYVLGMMQEAAFPLLIGFCQYEPHVLKLTPPLTITDEEVHQACATITAVLRRPFYQIVAAGLTAVLRTRRRALRRARSRP